MKLVIVGGGFCGTLVAKLMEKHAEVTLIDKKDYFEYIPSVHKVIMRPDYHKKIIIPFSKILKKTRVVTDKLVKIIPNAVKTEKETISFDYLVVSTGIDYPIRLENKKNVFTWRDAGPALNEKINSSEHILIVGGGLIGVEIAGELATKTKGKRIIIVHPKDRLLERNPVRASNYAKKYLEKHGTQIIFDEKVVDNKNNYFITDKQRKIDAEVAIWCAGIKCDPWFMKEFPDSIFTERKALKVNAFLQLEGYPNIFVGGDISSVKEEKTAQNAERHSKTISENIIKMLQGKELVPYNSKAGPVVISLSDWSAILNYNGHIMNGLFPGMLKWIIEWWVLRGIK